MSTSLLGLEDPITMHQGNTADIVYTLTDSSTEAAIDLMDAIIRFQVRKSYGASDWVINGTIANNKIVIVDAAAGKFKLHLEPGDTSSIKFDSANPDSFEGVYDIEVVTTTYGTQKPFYGTFTLNREVTR